VTGSGILLFSVLAYTVVVLLFNYSEAADSGKIGKKLSAVACACAVVAGLAAPVLLLSLRMQWPLWPSLAVLLPACTVTLITSLLAGRPRYFP